jgi:hypothetical protein
MQARRRIDQVLAPDFIEGLDDLSIDEIRDRRQLAGEVENELSYYRRLLHGRMDLIRFEQRRRSGDETRSLIEALPQILADPGSPTPPRTGRHVVTDLPMLPDVGKRPIDQILGDDVLLRLDDIDDDGLAAALDDLSTIESDMSDNRRRVQEVEDVLATVLAERYRSSV